MKTLFTAFALTIAVLATSGAATAMPAGIDHGVWQQQSLNGE